jgi:hypothetical protein
MGPTVIQAIIHRPFTEDANFDPRPFYVGFVVE